MTLDTRIYVHGEVDVHDLFRECRRLLGATTQTWRDRDASEFYGAGVWTIGNDLGQGLPALLDVKYRPGAMLHADADTCTEYCDVDDDYHSHKPAMWCEVSFDTTYGYRDAQGRGCGDLHACLVAQLGQWLDDRGVDWSWVNEFDGEVHGGDERYGTLTDLMSGGADASAWFRSVVLPVIRGRLA